MGVSVRLHVTPFFGDNCCSALQWPGSALGAWWSGRKGSVRDKLAGNPSPVWLPGAGPELVGCRLLLPPAWVSRLQAHDTPTALSQMASTSLSGSATMFVLAWILPKVEWPPLVPPRLLSRGGGRAGALLPYTVFVLPSLRRHPMPGAMTTVFFVQSPVQVAHHPPVSPSSWLQPGQVIDVLLAGQHHP